MSFVAGRDKSYNNGLRDTFPRTKWQVFLCHLGWHNWGHWWPSLIEDNIQTRYCKSCGLGASQSIR